MKKSISTRIRVTKNGKVITRKMAQGHNRAKKNSKQLKNKSNDHIAHDSFTKKIFKKQGTL